MTQPHTATPSTEQPTPALQVHDLCVNFGPVKALSNVNMTMAKGRVHALLGGNGSGKSTLIKVLAGVQPADSGSVRVDGATRSADSLTPDNMRSAGLRFVHQDIGIFNGMSVAENFALYAKYPTTPGGRVEWRQLRSYVTEILERFEINASPSTPVNQLRPASQTMLAIARALHDSPSGTRILVLDEPTAALPTHEAEELIAALRRRASAGQTIMFVGHRLREIAALADDITVLRDGQVADYGNASDLSTDRIIQAMAGQAVDTLYPEHRKQLIERAQQPAVAVAGWSAGPLRDVSFEMGAGEIVGIAGLLGSGRSSMMRSIFGDLRPAQGAIRVDSHVGPFPTPKAAISAGIGYVPEDRREDAAFLEQSVRENLSAAVARNYFALRGHLKKTEIRDSKDLVKNFLIKTKDTEDGLATLSGGNQQKVILARWMRRKPLLLLLDEPTQGVDVVARADIYRLIQTAAKQGTAILLASSDFEELAHLCDRILVLAGGRIACELDAAEATPENLHRLTQSLEQKAET